MLRTLAERLARAGVACLRFDYYGTGDAHGTDEESNLSGWRDDVATAHEELLRRAGGARTIWLGVRLGAVAALGALASIREDQAPPEGLVLWETIGSGRDYLEELHEEHRRALAITYSLAPKEDLADGTRELIGFGTGPTMFEELRALDGSSFRPVAVPTTWIVPRPRGPSVAEPPTSEKSRTIVLEHDFDWNTEEALNTALVPAEALRVLLEQVEALA
jgi:hypothetical protein